jgi:hypothetical protein
MDQMIARPKAEGKCVVLLSVDRARKTQVTVSYRRRGFVYLPSLNSLYLPRDAADCNFLIGHARSDQPSVSGPSNRDAATYQG